MRHTFGQEVPRRILEIPRLGSFDFHHRDDTRPLAQERVPGSGWRSRTLTTNLPGVPAAGIYPLVSAT